MIPTPCTIQFRLLIRYFNNLHVICVFINIISQVELTKRGARELTLNVNGHSVRTMQKSDDENHAGESCIYQSHCTSGLTLDGINSSK